MASSPLHGRLCIVIAAVVILLFMPLTFSGNNNVLAQAQSPQSTADEMIRKGYESHVKFYTACINTPPPPGITINCGPPPTPPQLQQSLDCNQLQTCASKPPKKYDWNEEDRENCEESRDFALGTLCEWIPTFLKRANEACDVIRASKIYQCYGEYPPDRHSYPKPQRPAPDFIICILFPSQCEA